MAGSCSPRSRLAVLEAVGTSELQALLLVGCTGSSRHPRDSLVRLRLGRERDQLLWKFLDRRYFQPEEIQEMQAWSRQRLPARVLPPGVRRGGDRRLGAPSRLRFLSLQQL
ncbi:uncharacterized protein LOC112348655 [Selaginella moellendorffii]|uniref:uncharacterized protein LOC112348655 n=1 Tax=Selaginella moellendorffii TaxID=88036 RepID=UPI000D1C8089|nr:uncharacterized protein LOC112348655 [Selaginella moellendorffii]|eukprot:XP_024537355.1 uncharacterized protein LOC112348655 [Selaginella moellendorffii]